MKRDMELVRRILIETERADAPYDAACFLGGEHATLADIAYHVELMVHHGLLDADTCRDMNGNPISCEIVALTWDGCDYLEAVRNDRVWKKTVDAIKKAVGSTTLALVKDVAVAISKQEILSLI